MLLCLALPKEQFSSSFVLCMMRGFLVIFVTYFLTDLLLNCQNGIKKL